MSDALANMARALTAEQPRTWVAKYGHQYLGTFATEAEAIEARRLAVLERHGLYVPALDFHDRA